LPDEFAVTASAPMAGPYDLPYSLKTVIQHPSDVNPRISTAEISLLLVAYNQIYGGIYSSPTDVFRNPFAAQATLAFDGLHTPSEVIRIFDGTPKEVLQPAYIKDIYDNPKNRFVQLLSTNNGYAWSDWKPAAPIKFYHGHADTEVPFNNSVLAVSWLESLGIHAELVDLGKKVNHGTGLLLGFQKALPWFESLRLRTRR